ncbi:hypothetical protein PB1_10574 [Bacillus methanolicus PB1]|uniref:Uncharacterized protein n=1 Tax=Bacillus methanolicus PB1 TaxID=997296 RepID=I3DUT4_BACMT|nr:hypothetical protein PB1_10574 [Bacillus methanolicus PB1]
MDAWIEISGTSDVTLPVKKGQAYPFYYVSISEIPFQTRN